MQLENYTNINIFKKTFEEREIVTSKNLIAQPHHYSDAAANKQHQKSQFNPYVNNQGTTIGKHPTFDLTNIIQQLPEETSVLLLLIPESHKALVSWLETTLSLLSLLKDVSSPPVVWLLILKLYINIYCKRFKHTSFISEGSHQLNL
jgi:hypothetical protein